MGARNSETAAFQIEAVSTGRTLDAVRTLFQEYERSLTVDLCFQGFAEELRTLPGPYSAPAGVLLLGKVGGEPAGCAALRPGPMRWGELKRLFVRPRFRRTGLGEALVRRVISEAKGCKYEGLVLDTLPEMVAAQRMYGRVGFHEIPSEGPVPVPGIRYFRLEFPRAP